MFNLPLSPFKIDYFNYDEISNIDEDFNTLNNDPFNLKIPSIFNENNDFRNDMFNASFTYDDYNANDDNNIRNNIDDFTQDVNKPEKKNIFGTTKDESKDKTSFSDGDKAINSAKSVGEPKTNNKVKLGRKRKAEVNNEEIDYTNVHTKEKPDNIKVKSKRLFFNYLKKYLNAKLIESKNPNLESLSFKKLNSGFIKSLKKDVINKMFDSPVFEVLSQPIAKKYKKFESDHNKKLVNLIFKENEENLLNIISKPTREIFRAFIGNTNDDLLLKNYRLDDAIKELSKKESKDYIEKLKYEAIHFEENFNKIIGRKPKKDKKKLI